MSVGLTQFSPLHDLIIGFYSGTAAGAGFTSMTLDVNVNGTDHVNTFTTVAAANAFFQNHAVDYGALGPLTPQLQLNISLSITESAAGGYVFGMLIGDPPPTPSHSAPASGGGDGGALAALGQAAASFTPGSGANVGGSSCAQLDNASPLLAAPHAVT
jgi:hypothetical protein